MYIMYMLNVSVCVNEFILFFLLFILCKYITDILTLILALCQWRLDDISSLSPSNLILPTNNFIYKLLL